MKHSSLLSILLLFIVSLGLVACSNSDKPEATNGGMTTAGGVPAEAESTTDGSTSSGIQEDGVTTAGETTDGTTIVSQIPSNTTDGVTTGASIPVSPTEPGNVATTAGGTPPNLPPAIPSLPGIPGSDTTAGESPLPPPSTTGGDVITEDDEDSNPDHALIEAISLSEIDAGDSDTSAIAGFWDSTELKGTEFEDGKYNLITADGKLTIWDYQADSFGTGENCYEMGFEGSIVRVKPGIYYNDIEGDVFTARLEDGKLVGTDGNGRFSFVRLEGIAPESLMLCQ